jgi:hypothetical protein
MKTAITKNATAKKAAATKESKLYLAHSNEQSKPAPVAEYHAGDMDMLELYDERPMPAAFQQFEKNYKAVHSFFGWPLPIV